MAKLFNDLIVKRKEFYSNVVSSVSSTTLFTRNPDLHSNHFLFHTFLNVQTNYLYPQEFRAAIKIPGQGSLWCAYSLSSASHSRFFFQERRKQEK